MDVNENVGTPCVGPCTSSLRQYIERLRHFRDFEVGVTVLLPSIAAEGEEEEEEEGEEKEEDFAGPTE